MDVLKSARTRLSKDNSFIWILAAVVLLVLAARIAWKIESNTEYFRENPVFTQGRESTLLDISLSVLLYLLHQTALCIWWNAIRVRIIQRGVRFFLLCAYGFTFIFALYGCLQLLVFNLNPTWFRISGYFYGVLGVVLPLPGFFAALCLGKPQDFFPQKRFFLVLLPAAILLILMMTNESHMLFFTKSPGENINLQFVPGILFYIMLLWGLIFHSLKIHLVYKVSKVIKTAKWQKALPFLTLCAIFVYLIPYMTGAMIWKREPLELAYFVFLVEALFWEFCIRLGYVQGNRYYEYIFYNSYIGMEILNAKGEVYLHSMDMEELSPMERRKLIKDGKIEEESGYTYYEKIFSGGYLVWRIDNRKIYQAIDILKQNREELELKLEMTQERLNLEQKERNIRDQKEIFAKLNEDVKIQLKELRVAYKEFKRERNADSICFRKMLCISVFLKRYVNLFLIHQKGDSITLEEMGLCLREFGEKLQWIQKTRTSETCTGKGNISPEMALLICKLWISLLEWAEYEPEVVNTRIEEGQEACLIVESSKILKKEKFLSWFSYKENPDLRHMEIRETKTGKRQEIKLIYYMEGAVHVSD